MKTKRSWNPLVEGSNAMVYSYTAFCVLFGYTVIANLFEGKPGDAIRHGLTLIAFLGILWRQQVIRKGGEHNTKLVIGFMTILIVLWPAYAGVLWLLPNTFGPESVFHVMTQVRLFCIAYLSGLLYFFVRYIIRRDFHAR